MLSVDRSKSRHYGDEHGRYWSVSQVVEAVTGERGFKDPVAMQRGTDIHQIFALRLGASMGWCDMPDVPDEYQGYDEAISGWIKQSKPQPMMLERSLMSKSCGYAGTMDYVGMIGDAYGVLDLKTGQPEKWHRLQLHGYQKLIDKAARMWTLYVSDNGKYRQVQIKYSARDWAAFQNGISVLQWREGN